MESEMEQRQYDECKSCLKNIATIDRLTAQLAKYKGGVEVEGVIVHVTDWISTKSGLYFPLPEKPFAKGQRVHVLVKEVE